VIDIDIRTVDIPPFLEEKMIIPGGDKGFAISYSSGTRKKTVVACGLIDNCAVTVRYTGDEYKLTHRKLISFEAFEKLCKSFPSAIKRSGYVFHGDSLDGETYLVKWSWGEEKTKLVLANPRDIDDGEFEQIANCLDDIMGKC
jgi:hypothetical protein